MKNIKKYIYKLRSKLYRWNYLYYVKNISEVSDHEYDLTILKLMKLEKKYFHNLKYNSPTNMVGSNISNKFNKFKHILPMLSLNSVYTVNDFLLFAKKAKNKLKFNQKLIYCCEMKFDGLAVNLFYQNGKLVHGLTRGDGYYGENITNNIYSISDIPVYLNKKKNDIPNKVEIRGEVVISKSNFNFLNYLLKKKNKKVFSNTRNVASGTLMQLNPYVVKERSLNFFAYSIGYSDDKNHIYGNHWESLKKIKEWGFNIDNYARICIGEEEVFNFLKYILDIKSKINFDIDGIVIKINEFIFQKKLGSSTKAPNWAISYKFSSKEVFTRLLNVEFKIGRTGVIIPVASIDPVFVDGVMIKHINLYNIKEIITLNLKIGDIVSVKRSGKVIPRITKVINKKHFYVDNYPNKDITLPIHCPSCFSLLKKKKKDHGNNLSSYTLYCTSNLTCKEQLKASLRHFISKKALYVKGMGKKIINQLVNKNLVNNPIDLFLISKKKLLLLNRIDDKLASKLIESLNKAKKTTFCRFLYALGINNVGEYISINLSKYYNTLDNLIEAKIDDLIKIKGISYNIAIEIYDFFHHKKNIDIINQLISPKIGINW